MMNRKFSVEVLMAAYNKADVMKFCLEGLLSQTDQEFTVAVADDGSGPEVKQLVDSYRQKGLNIRYDWHEDKGFRKAIILNRLLASSTADYILFIDNDCMPQSTYVEEHRHAATAGYFMAGRRIDLGPELTSQIYAGELPIAVINNRWWLIRQSIARRLRHGERGLRLPWSLALRKGSDNVGLLGSNMAMWREDLLRINGFDNDIPGGGGEEVDLNWRLRAAGVKSGSIMGRATVAHLYHKSRNIDPRGKPYRLAKIERNEFYARNGIHPPQQ